MVDWPVASVSNPLGSSSILLVCEHASHFIPPEYSGLSMAEQDLVSPAAWDPGALMVARRLSFKLDAVLIEATVSRLIYDCNRPPESSDAIRAQSELYEIPGNANISAEEHLSRVRTVHDPFHAAVDDALTKHIKNNGESSILISIHSFMPVYFGKHREAELGFLHGEGSTLAKAACDIATDEGRYRCRMNEPYSSADGVLYLIDRHGSTRGVPSLMLEISNALIASPVQAAQMGDYLASLLSRVPNDAEYVSAQ
jgi:predicted N-formylglutamate amidohydrolase